MEKNNIIFNYLIIILIILTIVFKLTNLNIFNMYIKIINYSSITIVISISIYFTLRLKFLQLNIIKILKTLIKSNTNDIKALFMSMGSKIGVGSLVGVSLSVYLLGPGVLLWIWIITILSSILTYCETYLGCKYKNKNNGGTFYYIKNGINNYKLSIIYTLLLIFIYAIGFVGIQSNTVLTTLDKVININKYILIIIILIIISIIVFNNTNRIISIMSKLVPIMCLIYILSGIFIIINISNIKDLFISIINDGINLEKSLYQIIIIGLQRGIFATESGIGTSSITTSISNSDKQKQGIFQIIGVHFISLIIITITGIITISTKDNYIGTINGIEIIMKCFENNFGVSGKILLSIIILLFAISTITSAYYFTIKGLEFIKNRLNKKDYIIIKLLIILLSLIGMIITSSLIWSIIDILVLFLLLINIYTIFKLRKEIS